MLIRGNGAGVPTALQGRPSRGPTTAMRPWDWALPPQSADLEVISAVPDGWSAAPRSDRRPPLLFVHGVGAAAWIFAEHWLGAAVRRGYPAHALSLRGHGGSGSPGRWLAPSLRDYVDDVMQTVISLPQPPVLVGHGMGAVVVQRVLERYPARAGVLVAPAPAFGAQQWLWSRVRASPRETISSLVAGRLPMRPDLLFDGLDEESAAGYLDRMARESPVALLQLGRGQRIGPVSSPVAVVGCRADAVIGRREVLATADMYDVKPIWLPGAGHLVMLDGSHSVGLDIVLDWVDGVPVDPVQARGAVRRPDPARP